MNSRKQKANRETVVIIILDTTNEIQEQGQHRQSVAGKVQLSKKQAVLFQDVMQGDHLSAKVTLAGCAQYDSEYARDFLTLEGSRDVLCIDTHSDTYNIPLQSLLVEIMALPSVLA